jgi:hypothetical protein
MKYNGSSWVYIGATGFSANDVGFTSLAIDRNRTPYVVFEDVGNSDAPTVMRFDTTIAPITGSDTLCVNSNTNLSDVVGGGIWSTSNTGMAVIGTTGNITGIATGSTTIFYTKSGYSATFTMVIDSFPVAGTLSASLDSVCVGDSIELHNTVPGGIWSSINTSVATITSSGSLTGVASGIVNLVYIVTNPCGSDTANYSFVVGATCPDGVINVAKPQTISFTILPNPNHGTFTLTISATQKEEATVIITNMLGGEVKEITATTNTDSQIQLDSPPGMYFITATTSQGTQTGKVMVW